MSVKSAAAKSDITPNSAYRFRKMWNEAGVTPTRHKRGPAEGSMSKLKDEHTKFIVDYVDREMGGGSLAQIKDALMKEFHGLSVSSSALHRHMKTKCAFSLKRIHKTPEARQDSDFVAFFEQWIASKDIDFESNCVFVSEANFMRVDRSSGWLSKEASRQKTQKRASGVMVTVLGAISYRGVIDVSLRRAAHGDTATIAATRLGKRRIDGTPINSSEDDHKHFLTYLTDLMNVLDRHGWQGYYLILDDTNIRDPALVKRKIEERGYRCAFLPTVMPVPNPMEKLWNKMQIGIDRRPLDGDLSQRIIDSCSEITPDDCHDWIRIALPCSPRSITSGRTSCFK
ncbi:MAG: hypothetical protein EXX96DRAFT_501648 [Benjaminiella poitrasii]|nr:MAG: hypothetical protein EXX96DRAFT_501648 [Benjaminiella poitrasii]